MGVSGVLSRGVGGWDLRPHPKLGEGDAGNLRLMGPLKCLLTCPCSKCSEQQSQQRGPGGMWGLEQGFDFWLPRCSPGSAALSKGKVKICSVPQLFLSVAG